MGKTVLIVEDEQSIVDILSFNLTKEGYDTLEALDGPTGLQLALDQQTGKMEPVEEQERTVLEVAQTVKAAQELRRCSRETDR